MRIAALADIHANAFALEAVLEDLERRDVDLVANLGDILYGPLEPWKTWELLKDRDLATVAGNQDRQLVHELAVGKASNPTMEWVLEDLGPEPVVWLDALPSVRTLETPDGGVFLCHGTPEQDDVYLLESLEGGEPSLRADAEIEELLREVDARLVLCGHSHVPNAVILLSGTLVVNPGSVGLSAYEDEEPIVHAMQTFSPHASYAIVEKRKAGWAVEHLRVPYDHHRAAAAARQREREDWARSLETGRRP